MTGRVVSKAVCCLSDQRCHKTSRDLKGSEQGSFLSISSSLRSAFFHIDKSLDLSARIMWRAGVDTKMNVGSAGDDDDWETDPDFVVGAEPRVTSSSCLNYFNI